MLIIEELFKQNKNVGVILLRFKIVLRLKITFRTTSLLEYFLMLGGTFGELGLLARAFLR